MNVYHNVVRQNLTEENGPSLECLVCGDKIELFWTETNMERWLENVWNFNLAHPSMDGLWYYVYLKRSAAPKPPEGE